ncbi:amino acid ABC transporter substrate-binding protein [Reyranella sp.]|uniref:amino acid ABC transporter substrate-binding protein n=1 Tax=Reyranella sp. TaxID=1929291 RepID=UPI003BAB1D52
MISLVLSSMAVGNAAHAGAPLDALKKRGELSCGTRGDTQGFARRDEKGQYFGLEVDICRAVAAALFGDAKKVKILPLDVAKRFPTLQGGGVDILVSGSTLTLSRSAGLNLDFVAIYYVDGQAFMVPRRLGKRSARELDGTTVCIQAGTTTAENVDEYFRENRMSYRPVLFDKVEELRAAFFAGKCDVFTADRSAVYAARAAYASNPHDFLVLPESASREPLSLIVRADDHAFSEIVRWAFYAMLEAEELGITSGNVDQMLGSNRPAVKRLLGVTPGLGKALGLDDKWAYNIIKQVGNYGEVYERNVGRTSALKIPRSMNELATQGGMQYAAPFR